MSEPDTLLAELEGYPGTLDPNKHGYIIDLLMRAARTLRAMQAQEQSKGGDAHGPAGTTRANVAAGDAHPHKHAQEQSKREG